MFQPASRSRVYLKCAFIGPSGSGKSWSSLLLARGLAGENGRIAAIDTENGSLSLYANVTPFDVVDLADFAPERYIEIIDQAEKAGYDVLIIDSFSHAWKYILEQKASLDARGGNQMMNWKVPKERMEKLKQKVLQSKIHIICNLRAKTEFMQVEGSKNYIKTGLAAVGEPDVEYEFTVVFSMGMDHRALCGVDGQGKDRTGIFASSGAFLPGIPTGTKLIEWLNSADSQDYKQAAEPVTSTPVTNPQKAPPAVSPTAAYLRDVVKLTTEQLGTYKGACEAAGLTTQQVTPVAMAAGYNSPSDLLTCVDVVAEFAQMGDIASAVEFAQMAFEAGHDPKGYLDNAKSLGVTDVSSILEMLRADDETQGDGEQVETHAPRTEPKKPKGKAAA